MNSPKFVIIGGAGKIAKYHFEAIEKVGGEVVAVIDPLITTRVDYFQYMDIKTYDKYALDDVPEYFVILSPNHLHVEHSAWALKYADVVCEKPLAISTSELAHLKSEESLGHTKVYPIMQMRKHPELRNLHEQFQRIQPYEIEINYTLPRDEDYHNSWQGDPEKSGGIVFNIAIHLLDFLVWTFGKFWRNLHMSFNHDMTIIGSFKIGERTNVKFYFSTAPEDYARRWFGFDGHFVDLLYPFALHHAAYYSILDGNPLSISDVEPTIKLCEEIRSYK